jgi:hypothetical protein
MLEQSEDRAELPGPTAVLIGVEFLVACGILVTAVAFLVSP